MTAITIGNAPYNPNAEPDAKDHMPLSVRVMLAATLNELWATFVNDMHDGPTSGPEVPEKFWKFVCAQGAL